MFFLVVGYTLVSSNINHCNEKWIITISIRIYHSLPISGLGPKFSLRAFRVGSSQVLAQQFWCARFGEFYQDFDLGLSMIYL